MTTIEGRHAMEMLTNRPMPAPRPTHSAAAANEPEFDLERIIYDPVYRRLVRDQLNRPAPKKPADGSRG
jgi:hypothetical protein